MSCMFSSEIKVINDGGVKLTGKEKQEVVSWPLLTTGEKNTKRKSQSPFKIKAPLTLERLQSDSHCSSMNAPRSQLVSFKLHRLSVKKLSSSSLR